MARVQAINHKYKRDQQTLKGPLNFHSTEDTDLEGWKEGKKGSEQGRKNKARTWRVAVVNTRIHWSPFKVRLWTDEVRLFGSAEGDFKAPLQGTQQSSF